MNYFLVGEEFIYNITNSTHYSDILGNSIAKIVADEDFNITDIIVQTASELVTNRLAEIYSIDLKSVSYYQSDVIIYHANCSDGLSAAAVANQNLNNPVLIPGYYGTPRSNFKDCNIYFVDFSYKKDDMEVLIKNNLSVHLIDHHKTAMEETEELEQTYGNFHWFVSKDNSKSGVGLAWSLWENFKPLPPVYARIQDRDLWEWKYEDSKSVLKAIDTIYDRTVEAYTELGLLTEQDLQSLKVDGDLLLKMESIQEAQIIKDSLRYVNLFEFVDVPCINCHGLFASNIGNTLVTRNEDIPFVLLWQATKKGVKISIRSEDHKEDASILAQKLDPNGGGHHNAAGVLLKYDNPFVKTLLDSI